MQFLSVFPVIGSRLSSKTNVETRRSLSFSLRFYPPWTSISNLFLPRLLPSFPTSLYACDSLYLYVPLSFSLSLADMLVLVRRRASESLSLSLSHICIYVRMCSPWCRFLSLLACTNYIYTEGRTELELKAAIERPTASEPWRPEFISSTPPFQRWLRPCFERESAKFFFSLFLFFLLLLKRMI